MISITMFEDEARIVRAALYLALARTKLTGNYNFGWSARERAAIESFRESLIPMPEESCALMIDGGPDVPDLFEERV